MVPLVSVVVPNWNGCHWLQPCLSAVAAQTYPAVETILVDNGSTDGSVEWVRQNFPHVRLIENAENRGFAAANNQGIRAARGEYVALLNNDAVPEPAWLAALVAAIEQDERIGMVASKMVFADQPGIINSTGIAIDRCGIVWDRASGQPDQPNGPPRDVFGPCAGAALYRRALFDDVGVFDEDFFIYLEDVDLAWRAQWRGWRAVYVPSVRVLHSHSAAMHEGSPRKTYLLARNKLTLLVKNYPWPYWLWHWPLIVFYEVLSLGFQVSRGRGGAALRGRVAALRALGRALRQRRALLAGRRVPPSAVFSRLQPVAWPWQVSARYAYITRRRPAQPAPTP